MIKAEAKLSNEKIYADCSVSITGNSEAIADEYAAITIALMEMEGGQTILDRAMDLMKKGMYEHEEKRSK